MFAIGNEELEKAEPIGKTIKCDRCHSFAVNKDPELKLCDVCYYKIPLLNLLAVVHRGGGHYTEEHGLKKSVRDAMKIMSAKVVI